MITSRSRSSSARNIVVAAACAVVGLLLSARSQAVPAEARFQAILAPLNASVGGGAQGLVTLTLSGDDLTLTGDVSRLSPGMHMMHIHGFTVAGKAATCAGSAQDTNGDHVIDLGETSPVSGTTLIPFDGTPITLQIATNTYPKATAAGEFTYQKTVSIKKLQTALKEHFGIMDLQLADRVIYVHGVQSGTRLPSTVKSLPGVPAALTLPVACGVIREMR